jgi:small-conductance mechanosensitive channel
LIAVVTQLGQGLLVFLVFWLGAKLLRDFIARLLQRRGARPDVILLATRVVYIGLIALGLSAFVGIALKSENVAITGFLAAAIVASLGVQDILRNYISGFYLLLERHVKVGDVIEHGGKTGVVTDVRLRVTFLREDDGALVMIPNALLFNDAVVIQPSAAAREGVEPGAPGPVSAPKPARRGLLGKRTRTDPPPAGSPPSEAS